MWNFTLVGGPGLLLAGCLIPALLILFFLLAQVGLAGLAFTQLGLAPWQGVLLVLACLVGSRYDLPVHTRKRLVLDNGPLPGWPPTPEAGTTLPGGERNLVPQVLALNVGGCVIPGLMCAYVLSQTGLPVWMGLGLALSSALCYGLARPRQGRGLALAAWVPPLAGALAAMAFAPPGLAALAAYVCGTLGAILGAEVLYLVDRRNAGLLDQPVITLGGRGTFWGIFLVGVVAGLLA